LYAGANEPIDQFNLGVRWDERAFRLQTVSRPDFDNVYALWKAAIHALSPTFLLIH
jgi:hypothetical protein